MLSNVWTVAKYTFLEGIRARFYIGAIVVSVAFVALFAVVASMPYGRVDDIIARIGWGFIFLTVFALAVVYAIQAIARERDQRVLHLMLSKPIARHRYALGKFLGIMALMVLTVAVEGGVLMAALRMYGEHPHEWLFDWAVPVLFVSLKCMVVLAYGMLFATLFVTPLVAMALTATLYFLGAGSYEFQRWAVTTKNDTLVGLGEVLRWLAPQFGLFDVEGWVIYRQSMTFASYGWTAGYFLGYAAVGLTFYVLALELQELQ